MDEDRRPDPDLLLREVEEERRPPAGGRLKIFFGYAAGVGKTYAMLEAAHGALEAGADVVVGYVEPHTRPETLALLAGLEQLAPRRVAHKNITLNEFDLDAALERRPALVLVDELAHTNDPSCRHKKRYQDIEELLKAGIDVYTTVNVQHIESLNDIVASITGVIVRERVPDSVFDGADQVELVDIEPDDLIVRLNRGKIYKRAQAQRALDNFFTRDNLVALREIALRRTADRLNRKKEREGKRASGGVKFADEHILICLSSSPSNAKVIRTAGRLAEAFHGTFTALFVETPGSAELSEANRGRLRENLRLAEQLGARIATMYGEDVPAQIAEYAQVAGVSKIVIGRSNTRTGLFRRRRNLVERLTALAPNLDIYVIPDALPPYRPVRPRPALAAQLSAADAGKTLFVLALCTLLGYFFFDRGFSESNIITVYILGVLLIAMATRGYVFSGVSSILSVLIFNFCFTDPYLSFRFLDPGYWVTFFTMFLSAFITSTLTMRVKRQARLEAMKSYRTQILLETSQVLQRAAGRAEIFAAAAGQLVKLLDRPGLFYPGSGAGLEAPRPFPAEGERAPGAAYLAGDERGVARWVYKNNKRAGAGTATLPGARCLYMAVRSGETVFAVVGLPMDQYPELGAFERNVLSSMLSEFALALEKEQVSRSKREIEVRARQEQLRSNLLRAISHDLRTPLTSISGNASILMADGGRLGGGQKRRLYTDIYDDSMWLINLVENLLSVTRIENGTMGIRMVPELVGEVLDEALAHVNRRASAYHIGVELSDELLMARMDSRLIIQVVINIVDNAIKYTPEGSHITLRAFRAGEMVRLEIADDGPGVPDEAKGQLFNMFYTVGNQKGDSRRGLGLGLSLCKSIIAAHGGAIGVGDNPPHGTVFYFTLQAEEVKVYE